jgi:hypothetical protein
MSFVRHLPEDVQNVVKTCTCRRLTIFTMYDTFLCLYAFVGDILQSDKNDQDNMAWVVFIIICRYYTKLRKVISINKSENDSKRKISFKC